MANTSGTPQAKEHRVVVHDEETKLLVALCLKLCHSAQMSDGRTCSTAKPPPLQLLRLRGNVSFSLTVADVTLNYCALSHRISVNKAAQYLISLVL